MVTETDAQAEQEVTESPSAQEPINAMTTTTPPRAAPIIPNFDTPTESGAPDTEAASTPQLPDKKDKPEN